MTPLAKKPGFSRRSRVVDDRFDRERAHRLVERRADVGDLAVEQRVAERLHAELDRLARLR